MLLIVGVLTFLLCIYLAIVFRDIELKMKGVEAFCREINRLLLAQEQKSSRKDPEDYKKEEKRVMNRIRVRKHHKKKKAAKKIDRPKKDQAETASDEEAFSSQLT